MSTWRRSDEDEAPQNYVDLLYGSAEEGSTDESGSDNESELGSDESESRVSSPEAPPYSPLTSPERRERLSEIDEQLWHIMSSRSRSRSPIDHSASEPAGVVIQIYDANGVALDALDDEVYLAPDTHVLYVTPEERDRDVRHERSVSVQRGGRRSGRRGGRSVQGQGSRGRAYLTQGRRGRSRRWKVGQPLHEICTTDDDVPPELVSLAMDVMRRRQARMHGASSAERIGERDDARESENDDARESENDDEFSDAGNGADVLSQPEGSFERSLMDSFRGQEEHFMVERTGSVHVFNSAYDTFRLYWSDDILDLISDEMNPYATKIVSTAFQSE